MQGENLPRRPHWRIREPLGSMGESGMICASRFRRHGFGKDEAFIRVGVLYFMEIGYYALELEESLEQRLRYTTKYIFGFTGVEPASTDIEAFRSFARFGH